MRKRVLFVCYGNACRSIMAEALARHHFGDALEVASAGIMPLGWVAPDTLEVLKKAGIPSEGLSSKGLLDLDLRGFDLIVNLTDLSLKRFLHNGFAGRIVDCPVRDPFGEHLGVYKKTLDAIQEVVIEKLPRWIEVEAQGNRNAAKV